LKIAASLDTNVLVRLIVNDDPIQTQVVLKTLEKHVRRSEVFWLPVTVILELEWVLRSRYKFPKPEFIKAMSLLLKSVELNFESEGAVEQALASYEDGNADYAEYLHLALAHKNDAIPFLTFDQKASKATGARLLK
jgi:predicted nucleic-acid-binding protein